ncbi:MAG: hypothetical protein WAQ52_11615 [Terriglobales bacterium]
MRRVHEITTVILAMAGLCSAQNAASGEQEMIRLLAQQVKELQEKVAILEARSGSSATASAEVPPQPHEEPSEAAPPRELLAHDLEGIQWRGFAEVNYKVLNQRQPELGTFGFVPGSAGNFYAGDFDLFFTSRINDRASVLAEIVFGEGDAESFGVDVERALVKYDYNDHLKISVGRYHTGIGYYNTAVHSGKWLLTTADRPLVMEFADDGGLLPTQAVGVSLTGLVPSGKLGLNYLFEYGSSDTVRPETDGSGTVDDENNGNHINVGIFARPEAIPGLQIGGSFYHDKISQFELGPDVRLSQSIVNGHVVYIGHGIEFLNEGVLIRHSIEHSDVRFNMPAFYSQFSRKFGSIRPFVRYQYVNANAGSIFQDVVLRHGPSFGVRYDFNESMAFKTQLDHTIRKGKPDLNGLQMQLVVAF